MQAAPIAAHPPSKQRVTGLWQQARLGQHPPHFWVGRGLQLLLRIVVGRQLQQVGRGQRPQVQGCRLGLRPAGRQLQAGAWQLACPGPCWRQLPQPSARLTLLRMPPRSADLLR